MAVTRQLSIIASSSKALTGAVIGAIVVIVTGTVLKIFPTPPQNPSKLFTTGYTLVSAVCANCTQVFTALSKIVGIQVEMLT